MVGSPVYRAPEFFEGELYGGKARHVLLAVFMSFADADKLCLPQFLVPSLSSLCLTVHHQFFRPVTFESPRLTNDSQMVPPTRM